MTTSEKYKRFDAADYPGHSPRSNRCHPPKRRIDPPRVGQPATISRGTHTGTTHRTRHRGACSPVDLARWIRCSASVGYGDLFQPSSWLNSRTLAGPSGT